MGNESDTLYELTNRRSAERALAAHAASIYGREGLLWTGPTAESYGQALRLAEETGYSVTLDEGEEVFVFWPNGNSEQVEWRAEDCCDACRGKEQA